MNIDGTDLKKLAKADHNTQSFSFDGSRIVFFYEDDFRTSKTENFDIDTESKRN